MVFKVPWTNVSDSGLFKTGDSGEPHSLALMTLGGQLLAGKFSKVTGLQWDLHLLFPV